MSSSYAGAETKILSPVHDYNQLKYSDLKQKFTLYLLVKEFCHLCHHPLLMDLQNQSNCFNYHVGEKASLFPICEILANSSEMKC